MITASIVIYNSPKKDLQIVVACAANSSISTIYIVDNAPNDNFKEFAQSLSEKVVYIQGCGNIGYGAAHNIAIRKSIESGANYHLVLNPDIEFKQGTIEKLVEFMDDNSTVGLVMPKISYPTGEIQYLCKLLPTPFDWIFRRFCFFMSIVEKRNEKYELRASGYDKVMNIPYLSGCFMLFRTLVLLEVGLFDEGIFMYGEDTDITRRIHKKYRTIFYPKVTAVHRHNKESYRSYRLLWIHIKAAIYYFNKWGWLFDKERREINKRVLKELGI
ncbi:MAG: glycosyltransferase family 2 protein [Prevotellaceae bacterium]|jgi:GT2 family glycosyltransferase|nr:glycosyltransferase family 2 protein [Prevotellaceae bacterium]